MSKTPNQPQRKLAQYNTPDTLALAICRRLFAVGYLFNNARVLEPSVGGGAFIRALRQLEKDNRVRFAISAIDLDPDAPGLRLVAPPVGSGAHFGVDFIGEGVAERFRDSFDVAIMNPPFSRVEPGKKRGPVVAHEHILAGLVCAPVSVGLVRCGLLTGSAKRTFGIDSQIALRMEVWPRPSFTGGGPDSCEYLCGVWTRTTPSVTVSEVLDWRTVGEL